ncbi:CBL-interacting protein kinase 33 [Daldinia childiae]|uniref:CBL-interacting protein kinase 33 n=1 Tax=Daldinia childiae TaxID=326645 RepID=UPI0014476BF6|nr:CBL-interacting protein kinase 33 [Daldinia childiae]KAF3059490.1 CBL-interacting protein kinase 33 [Daldinia childiae]
MQSYTTASSQLTFVYSRRRSSRFYENDVSGRQETKDIIANITSESQHDRGLNLLIQVIDSSGLHGPALSCGTRHYLGQGSQFLVTKQTIMTYTHTGCEHVWVAIKQPKFVLDHDQSLNHGHESARRYLNDVYVEVAALTNKALRQHPNIVRLLSWTFSQTGIHSPISLVMELADWTLNKYLEGKKENADYDEKRDFTCDIANGLDALHKNGFVHGDLKPENILIFQQHHRRVAKIADFGLCVSDTELAHGVCLGGTQGWQAPEVESGRLLTYDGLIKADNYSFGLLTWSMFFENGQTPPNELRSNPQSGIEQKIKNAEHTILGTLSFLEPVLPALLQPEPDRRPESLTSLFPAAVTNEDFKLRFSLLR